MGIGGCGTGGVGAGCGIGGCGGTGVGAGCGIGGWGSGPGIGSGVGRGGGSGIGRMGGGWSGVGMEGPYPIQVRLMHRPQATGRDPCCERDQPEIDGREADPLEEPGRRSRNRQRQRRCGRGTCSEPERGEARTALAPEWGGGDDRCCDERDVAGGRERSVE